MPASILRFFRKRRALRGDRKKSRPKRVHLNYWDSGEFQGQGLENLGDMLAPVVVWFLLDVRGIDPDKPVGRAKELFALGSALFWKGYWENMTVWGSGCLRHDYPTQKAVWKYRILHHLLHRVDVRAVRGPRTRDVLRKLWLKCPEVYGDPAILLPLFHQPNIADVREYNLIPHHTNRDSILKLANAVDILTADWKATVDAICSARLNVSSSLHGIILSEAYGIPAVLLLPESGPDRPNADLFKYDDYYRSTGRERYPVASSVEEALQTPPPPLPNLRALQDGLIRAFPYDLWDA